MLAPLCALWARTSSLSVALPAGLALQVHYNSLCVKVPESPSEGSASEDSSGSESSDPGGDSGSRSSKKLLGSKKLRRALIGH